MAVLAGMALREDVIGAPNVEYKAPDKVTIPELVAGLHPMNLARDVIDQEGDTLEFMPIRLVVAMVAQIFLYMIDSGIRYSTATSAPGRRSFSFKTPRGNPTLFDILLCMPNQDAQADVQGDDEVRLHRTAIGQVLAFTLQALAIEPPTQKWHDVAHDQLTNWKVKYLDVFCSSSNIVNCPHHS
ncbi:similar to Pc17g00310 [Aspergillus luchuensis IFO 4308]|nr:similar to Pc17g00310 [Aspergillus luchuensis IFO 4308]